MKRMRFIAWVLCLVLAVSGCALAQENSYRTLETGMTGNDVYALKVRLQELGYIKSVTGLNKNYSEGTANYIRQLQANNGLPETGIATPELQELIYSDACVTAQGAKAPAASPQPAATEKPAAAATAKPAATVTAKPAATPQPASGILELPETDEEGFMLPGKEPYVYASRDTGHWYYIAQDLRIEIHKCADPSIPLVWFETYVSCRNDEKIRAYVGGNGSSESHFKTPKELQKKAGFVLSLSDDFYTHRVWNRGRVGTVIRNGEILYDQQASYGEDRFPPLDILAFFPDGEMKTYYSDEITATELLALGAEQALCFGPILVRDGVMDQRLTNSKYYDYAELHPRHAVGMLSPNHYVFVSALGRRTESQGTGLKWMAEKMMELGCREAFNLDGGNTMALMFMGDLIDRPVSSTNYRPITSLIGFGSMEK